MHNKLDFIIIGAQKAGTTSLAAYLNENPDIFIPPEKEIPFFLDPSMQKKGWRWFMDYYFSKAREKQLLGTSSPPYMMYPKCFKAIKNQLPDVKLIAIIRDPISRLLSHYDMLIRFGLETRLLVEIIKQQLDNIDYYRNTEYIDRTGKYIVAGEYGRTIEIVLKYFRKDQLLVLDFEDFKRDPQAIVNQISIFIGTNAFLSKTINQVRMSGGNKRRININHNRLITVAGQILHGTGLKQLVPDGFKRRVGLFSNWLDSINVDPQSKSSCAGIEPSIVEALKKFYAEDQKILNEINVITIQEQHR